MAKVGDITRHCRLCEKPFYPKERNSWYCETCPKGRDFGSWSLNYKKRLKRLCQMAKNRATVKELVFDIDGEYLISLWDDNQGCCALTGQEFDLTPWGEKGQVNPQAPSVDRIKPKLGYIKGNVRLITYHMNISLSDFGTEEFERLLRAYQEFN